MYLPIYRAVDGAGIPCRLSNNRRQVRLVFALPRREILFLEASSRSRRTLIVVSLFCADHQRHDLSHSPPTRAIPNAHLHNNELLLSATYLVAKFCSKILAATQIGTNTDC
jgi:hypothetical protein